MYCLLVLAFIVMVGVFFSETYDSKDKECKQHQWSISMFTGELVCMECNKRANGK